MKRGGTPPESRLDSQIAECQRACGKGRTDRNRPVTAEWFSRLTASIRWEKHASTHIQLVELRMNLAQVQLIVIAANAREKNLLTYSMMHNLQGESWSQIGPD